MVTTHFFIGVAVGVLVLLVSRWLNIERPLQFGGKILSLGLPSRWFFWSAACFSFEILSSCKTPAMYQEIAFSIIEAPAMALGVFVVDRLCRWEEVETHINSRFSNTFKPTPTTKATNGLDHEAAKKHFEDLTRDK